MQKLFKRAVLMGVAFVVLFTLMSASYADTATLTYERLWPLKARLTGPDGYNFQVPCNKKLLDGEIAFCLEPLLEVVNGGTYTAQNQFPGLSAATVDKLERIVYLAWERSGKEPEDYFATSLLVWEALGYEVTSTTGFEVKSYSARREAVATADKALLKMPSFNAQEVTLKTGESLTLQDDAQVFSSMHTSSSTQPTSVQITRSGHQLTLTALKAGTDVLQFQKVPDSYVGTSIFWETPTAGKQNLATLKLRTSILASVKVRVSEPTGTISVSKSDEKGQALPGVEMTLYNDAKVKQGTGVTNDQGQVSFGGVVYGDYFIQESKALPGYVLDSTFHPIRLQAANAALALKNQPIVLQFEKRDRLTETPLVGAVLELLQDGKKLYTWTSTETPFLIRALPAGTYQLIESAAPPSYHLMTAQEIAVKESAEVQKFIIYNEAVSGKILVQKRDGADHTPLPGAVICLYKADGTMLEEKTSDADGKVQFTALPAGEYYYLEKQAPDGYEANLQEHHVEIGRDQNVLECTLDNAKIYGHPEITKLDLSTKAPLPDALIAIYNEQDELVEEQRTDETGRASFAPLASGNYYFLEREAPQGYVLNPEKHPFRVSTQGQIIKAVLENERILVQPTLTKLDVSTEAPLAGAKIALHDEDDTLIEEQVTDESGYATFTALPVGSYYFLESEAPHGYILNPEKHPFRVSAQGQIIKAVLENERILVHPTLTKLDLSTQTPLAGAKIALYAEDDTFIEEQVTDESGYAEFAALPVGSYYFLESKAPQGYNLNPDKHPFHIDEMGQVVRCTLTNTRIEGDLLVRKIDRATRMPLGGAVFEVMRGDEVVARVTSDEQGQALLRLPYGEYILREVQAPAGYVCGEGVMRFQIRTQDERLERVVENSKETAKLPRTGISHASLYVGTISVALGVLFQRRRK